MSLGDKTIWSAALDSDSATALEELGVVRTEYDATNGKRMFVYAQFDNGAGNVTSAANQVVYLVAASAEGMKVTNDVSDSDIQLVVGVDLNGLTDTYYGWIQIQGHVTAVATNGDDDIAAYDNLIGGGDGTCNSVAQDTAPTNTLLGIALAADTDAANTVEAQLTNPLNL